MEKENLNSQKTAENDDVLLSRKKISEIEIGSATSASLFSMALHEVRQLDFPGKDEKLLITRVPGGWIYQTTFQTQKRLTATAVFVPLNSEFSPACRG